MAWNESDPWWIFDSPHGGAKSSRKQLWKTFWKRPADFWTKSPRRKSYSSEWNHILLTFTWNICKILFRLKPAFIVQKFMAKTPSLFRKWYTFSYVARQTIFATVSKMNNLWKSQDRFFDFVHGHVTEAGKAEIYQFVGNWYIKFAENHQKESDSYVLSSEIIHLSAQNFIIGSENFPIVSKFYMCWLRKFQKIDFFCNFDFRPLDILS